MTWFSPTLRRVKVGGGALQSQHSVEAKHDYEVAKGILSEMNIENRRKLLALRSPHNLGNVHEESILAISPSNPNLSIPMGITIGAGVGLLLAFPLAGMMVTRS